MFTYNKNDDNEKRNLSQKLTEIEIVDTYINSHVNITTESVFFSKAVGVKQDFENSP